MGFGSLLIWGTGVCMQPTDGLGFIQISGFLRNRVLASIQ